MASGVKTARFDLGDSTHATMEKSSSGSMQSTKRPHFRGAKDVLRRYDKNQSGKLGRPEVRQLLEDLNRDPSIAVTDHEIAFVFKIAAGNSPSGSSKNTISEGGITTLMNTWENYQKSRPEIDKHFRKHDPEQTGHLGKGQLSNLLAELDRGQPPTEEELVWILKQARPVTQDVICKPELRRVLALWESHLKARAACCIVQ